MIRRPLCRIVVYRDTCRQWTCSIAVLHTQPPDVRHDPGRAAVRTRAAQKRRPAHPLVAEQTIAQRRCSAVVLPGALAQHQHFQTHKLTVALVAQDVVYPTGVAKGRETDFLLVARQHATAPQERKQRTIGCRVR